MYLQNHLQKLSLPKLNSQNTNSQKRLTFFGVSLCLVSLSTLSISPASAQVTQAKVQEILDGNQVFIQNKRAALNDVARQRQQVRTGNSRASLVFNTGAVARLSANSVLQIGQCAQLRRGTILINGAVNACSSSITAGVRGTTYLLEVDESGNQQITVLEGEVSVKRNSQPLENFDQDPEDLDEDENAGMNGNRNGDINDNNTNSTNSNQRSTSVVPKLPVTRTIPRIPSSPQSTTKPTIKPTTNSNVPRVLSRSNQTLPNSPVPKTIPSSTPSDQPQSPDEVVLQAGERVEVSDRGVLGIVQELSENEFVGLLTGSLFQGFTNQIPSLDKIRSVFNIRFPNVNFPLSIPNIPRIPIPSIPSFPRFPF